MNATVLMATSLTASLQGGDYSQILQVLIQIIIMLVVQNFVLLYR